MKNKTNRLGIIYINGGTTWYQGSDENKISVECAKMCKKDWKHLFKFKKHQEFKVNIYDISEAISGWWSDYGNVYCDETQKQMPFLKTITVIV